MKTNDENALLEDENDDLDADTAPESPAIPSTAPSEKSRGAFDVRTKSKGGGQAKQKLYIGIAIVVLVFATVIIGGWSLIISKMKEGTTDIDETTIKKDAALEVSSGSDDSMVKLKEETLKREAEKEAKAQAEKERLAKEEEAKKPPPSKTATGQSARSATPGTDGVEVTPLQRKLGLVQVITPVVVDVSSFGASGTGSKAENASPALPSGVQETGTDSSSALGGASRTRGSLSDLGGTEFTATRAFLMPSRKYLLSHGTYTTCITYAEIVTDHPGIIDCRLTEPVYSADGSTVLAEAGDRLTGEQSVEMKQGQVRVFTSWTELETQTGVRARLASLGAGPMGASGTEAWIDNHYRQRFGGAILLSIIQDALQAASNMTQKGGASGGYTVNNSEQNVENMADKALENTINIQPTAHIPAGTVMTVIVARDIDFSSVYENR
ncbi:TrbI/VirB10 family protein [Pseudomonas kitaguniensis]|uniref:TrbI/VirB10 family protein n=1 Tax=Pseudomonas kitaguniensis TaxID=2607908 RepID=UPI003BA082C6